MRFYSFKRGGELGLAIDTERGLVGLTSSSDAYPGELEHLLRIGGDALARASDALLGGDVIDPGSVQLQPPIAQPGKIICVGLNYVDHTAEVEMEQPDYPTIFTRFGSTLIGSETPLVCPRGSQEFDYEGEIALIIGQTGRHIKKGESQRHIAGWSLFNDASVRDYQFKSPQWTMGKNFDATGAFGPCFVTADEIAEGAQGITLETRLNGETVQSAPTEDMVFDVPTLIEVISEVMTLEPGDVIVTGTPAGVGMARDPKLWMKPGDTVEVEATGLGVLRNSVVAE